jgi:hypothetical protein
MRLILGKSATVSVLKGEVQSQVLTPIFIGVAGVFAPRG